MEMLTTDDFQNDLLHLDSKPFTILTASDVFVLVRKLFTETTILLAARTPNRFDFNQKWYVLN